jgi:hemolysin III
VPAAPTLREPPAIAESVLARPLLRGWSHALAFALVGIAGLLLLATTDASKAHRLALVVYLVGTLSMFGVSGLYHRGRWTEREIAVWRRLDHSTIFVAIGGAYTPISIAAFHGPRLTITLLVVWIGAALGVLLQWLPLHIGRALFTIVYIVVGWSIAPSLPQLWHGLGVAGFALVLGGGLAYSVGAAVYARRRPDPWPQVFGYHELFHLLTVAGAVLHFVAIAVAVMPRL